MKKKVVCIGQALVDCITRGKEPWRERVYRAQSISLNTGGDALNEASLLAKMGIPVSLVCGLGGRRRRKHRISDGDGKGYRRITRISPF